MFDTLLRILTGSDDAPPAAYSDERNDPALALAVLLLETARSDDCVADSERRIIERVLARRFRLQPFETARLVAAARQGATRATDLYHSPESSWIIFPSGNGSALSKCCGMSPIPTAR